MKSKSILLFVLTVLAAVFFLSFSVQRQVPFDLKASIARGKEAYIAYCISCHMENGEGLEAVYPPLVKADYLMADQKRSIQQVLYGAKGEMKVNGKVYNMEMTGFDLSDQEVSDILNYIRNSWGNKAGAIKPEEVKAARK
jgi:mono/diheme cytochrome c family protein